MSEAAGDPSLRSRGYHLLHAHEDTGLAGRALRVVLISIVVVSVSAAVVKSVPSIGKTHGGVLDLVLLTTSIWFALEYFMRLWTAPEGLSAPGALRSRLRYVVSLPGIIDLVAGIPFALAPHLGLNLDWLDIVPIFKLLRHTAAFQFLVEAVYSERRVLGSAAVLMLSLLVFFSSLVYHLEREAQPDKLGSIPEAMWWGIVTLTTLGYGDVTPITPQGKLVGGITAMLGLCMFAIPVGIIASAFIDAVRRREFVDTWNLVAKVPLFRTLDAARIAAVASVLRARRAERGERLIRKGDTADSMYFIVSGEVEMDMETGAPTRRMVAGDFFGEVALIATRTRTASITAITVCKLLVLHKDDFDEFMDAHPDLKAAVRAASARRLAETDLA